MARSFELDDRHKADEGASARPSRSPRSRDTTSRAMRARVLGTENEYNSFEARVEVPPIENDVADLWSEVENLRECLNRILDVISEVSEDDGERERRTALLNDRMAIVERRLHEVEWSDAAADLNRDMASS